MIQAIGLRQQSTSESNPWEDGQLSNPHTRPVWHSSLESQSPLSSPQGIPDVQKISSPRVPVEVSVDVFAD